VTAFFLPIFFTYTGLRTDVGSVESASLWGICGLVTVTAVIGKFGGCSLAAWFSRYSMREAACIGALMNTRALMAFDRHQFGQRLGRHPRQRLLHASDHGALDHRHDRFSSASCAARSWSRIFFNRDLCESRRLI
jgi:hypothetical protein